MTDSNKDESQDALQHLPAIIREAAASPLGVIALVVIVLAVIAFAFFRGSADNVRLVVFLSLLLGAGLLVVAVIRVRAEVALPPVAPNPSPSGGAIPKPSPTSSRPSVLVVAGRWEESPPFAIDAEVIEEDTFLVLGADPEARELAGGPRRHIRDMDDTYPKAPGSVLIRAAGSRVRMLAVVHDLERDPTWQEEWIGTALGKLLVEADERGYGAISLPVLGSVHSW
jgi:hypothetical protein